MAGLGEQCPLRLECVKQGECPTAVIAFDTLDGYPGGVVDQEDYETIDRGYYKTTRSYVAREGFLTTDQAYRYGDNDVCNDWPMEVCDASGALAKENGLSARDRGWLHKLGGIIVGNTWHNTLQSAATRFPNAPWAEAFRNEYERREHPTPVHPELSVPAAEQNAQPEREGWLRRLMNAAERLG